MRYTKEYAEILDKIFNYYVEYEINKSTRESPSIRLFVKRFNISKPILEEAISEICTIGTELELLKANKSGYGDWDVVSMNEYKCKQFQKNGGFTGLYNYESREREEKLRKSEIEIQLADLDLQDKSFKVKTKRLPYFISGLALIISGAPYLFPQSDSTKVQLLEQRIEQMDLKIISLEKAKLIPAQDSNSILPMKKFN